MKTKLRSPIKFSIKLIVILIVALVLLSWLSSRVVWIPAGHVGVLYNARTGLQKSVYKPQAKLIGIFDQLYTYPTKLQAAIYTEDPSFGEQKAADGIEITTSDSAITKFDVTVLYRVRPEDVFIVFDKFGPIPIEDIQTLHIRRAVREAASAVGTHYDVFDLLGPKRLEASQTLTKEVRNRMSSKGITVVLAMLNTAHPSRDMNEKITSRVNAYTQLEISKLESQIAEVSRQSSIVRGAAEAEARMMTGRETQAKSIEMLKLELQEDAIAKWGRAGGKLSPIVVRPGQTVIVNGSSLPAIVGSEQ